MEHVSTNLLCEDSTSTYQCQAVVHTSTQFKLHDNDSLDFQVSPVVCDTVSTMTSSPSLSHSHSLSNLCSYSKPHSNSNSNLNLINDSNEKSRTDERYECSPPLGVDSEFVNLPDLKQLGSGEENEIEGDKFFINSANFTLRRVKSLSHFGEEKGPCKDISFVSSNTDLSPSHLHSEGVGHEYVPTDLARPIDLSLTGPNRACQTLTDCRQSQQQRQQPCYSRCGIGGVIDEAPLDLSLNSVSDMSDGKSSFLSPSSSYCAHSFLNEQSDSSRSK